MSSITKASFTRPESKAGKMGIRLLKQIRLTFLHIHPLTKLLSYKERSEIVK